MPHPGEVSAASTPRRSILETFGGESDDDIMDVDDEIEDDLDDLQEEGGVMVVDPDAEAEQFFTAVNEQESDSDSEIEFVSMTGPALLKHPLDREVKRPSLRPPLPSRSSNHLFNQSLNL